MFRLASIITLLIVSTSHAQQLEEVFLGFRYQGGVNMTVIGYSKDEKTYLPVIELFRELYINVTYDTRTNTVHGFYVRPNVKYSLDLGKFTAKVGDKSFRLNQEDFYIGESDVYLDLETFYRLFELDFSVDYTYLVLRLVANQKLPIVVRFERERARNRATKNQSYVSTYPMLQDRNKQFWNGYFMDYSLSQQYESNQISNSSALFTFGNETLYGDVQGTWRLNKSLNQQFLSELRGLRYRYLWNGNPYISQISIGQLQSQTANVGAFDGFRINNAPLYQNNVFDELMIDQQTIPESEIEIYSNNRLIDVITSDELGNFRIGVPITYGVNDIKVSIFGPNGEMLESERRIEIPFNFIPKGTFQYDIGAGRSSSKDLFTSDRLLKGYAQLSYAPTSFFTTTFHGEHIATSDRKDVLFTSLNSIRLFNSLLTQANYSPGHFYRIESVYQTASGTNLRGYYGAFDAGSFTNRTGSREGLGGSLFTPLPFLPFQLSTRISYDKSVFDVFDVQNSNVELNTRVQRVAVRTGYRETLRTNFASDTESRLRRYVVSSSYTIPPRQSYWKPIRGLFVRGQMDFDTNISRLEQTDISVSRRIIGNGRVQFSWLHNVAGGFNSYFLSLSLDFDAIRWSSSSRYVRDSRAVVRQSVRGSVTYDRANEIFWFDNRQQVGRSAVSARLFVDVDGDGIYSEGDEQIPDNALRILGAGSRVKSKNGISAISQLQQYRRYDVEINTGAIRNPSLVPVLDKFAIVTDPNQHKTIQIPFERTGVFDGGVTREVGGKVEGVSGLRLNLKEVSGKFEAVVRTFSDGSFYQFEVPPGDYILTVDTLQLGILKSRSLPDTIRFRMRSLPDGDMVEGLSFKLESLEVPISIPVVEPEIIAPVTQAQAPQYFRIQTAMMSTLARAIMAKLDIEEKTGVTHEIQYNARWDNYRVFSTEIQGLDNALAAINALRKSQFSDAFIISEQIFATEDVFYAVQVGAFPDSSSAVRHVADIKAAYGLTGHIQFDALSNHFQVVLEPMSNFLTASTERDRVRRETGITDAFLITQPNVNARDIEFSVQFGMFDTQSQAFQLSQRLTNRQGVQNFVVSLGGKFYVRSRPTNRLEDAVNLYRRARTLGYTDAIIHTVRS